MLPEVVIVISPNLDAGPLLVRYALLDHHVEPLVERVLRFLVLIGPIAAGLVDLGHQDVGLTRQWQQLSPRLVTASHEILHPLVLQVGGYPLP